MRTRANFGIVGPVQTQTSSRTGGLFTADDQVLAKKAGLWSSTPSAPTITGVTPANGFATVSFTAPTNNGGSNITSYLVTSSPGNISVSGSTSPIIVSGLTNGTTYTFTVSAYNVLGYGTPSAASSPVTPLGTISTIDLLLVAGGGGGGKDNNYGGAGAGAGGVLYQTAVTFSFNTQYTVTVGAGGTGGLSGANTTISGTGFTTITAVGGGGGGVGNGSISVSNNGGNGGSGGGALQYSGATKGVGIYPGSTYINDVRQGYDGGAGVTGIGSGGGAGAAGTTGSSSTGAVGGAGTSTYSTWLQTVSQGVNVAGTYYIAGGGGSGTQGTGAAGGAGGGGGATSTTGNPGATNTGGGGGGGNASGGYLGGTGGSGLVLLRYPDSFAAPTSVTGTFTSLVTGGYRNYTFTGSGTITF